MGQKQIEANPENLGKLVASTNRAIETGFSKFKIDNFEAVMLSRHLPDRPTGLEVLSLIFSHFGGKHSKDMIDKVRIKNLGKDAFRLNIQLFNAVVGEIHREISEGTPGNHAPYALYPIELPENNHELVIFFYRVFKPKEAKRIIEGLKGAAFLGGININSQSDPLSPADKENIYVSIPFRED